LDQNAICLCNHSKTLKKFVKHQHQKPVINGNDEETSCTSVSSNESNKQDDQVSEDDEIHELFVYK